MKEFNKFCIGIYSEHEIRKLSSLTLQNHISINKETGKPVTGGLYDPVLGPIDSHMPCGNCKLSFTECNGHFGSIEFPKPVYYPVLFEDLMKLIKGICFHCHRFYMRNGLLECLKVLGYEIEGHPYNLSDIENLRSISSENLLIEALKRIASTPRLKCTNCGGNSYIFSKSRQCEVLVRVSKKQFTSKRSNDAKIAKLDFEGSTNTTDSPQFEFCENDFGIIPEYLRNELRKVWNLESKIIRLLFPILNRSDVDYPTDLFFQSNMLVSPVISRTPAFQNGSIIEDPETANYSNVIQMVDSFTNLLNTINDKYDMQSDIYKQIREMNYQLQVRVNICFDSDKMKGIRQANPGIRQMIDKKLGLIRNNMMGKRVNFACRSVITPDPNLGLNEVGTPKCFLKKLTFPEKLCKYNKNALLKAVINGPDVYPGAVSYSIDNNPPIRLSKNLESIASHLEVSADMGHSVYIYRHATNKDYLIMNRQPTLHKPSMQAHKIAPIADENAKTLRMHYSNCKAYNADFDGDEMNGHFPQTRKAQIEAANLMNACYQHSTVKDGSPLAGLIQDHIISGVYMSMRNCFLTYSSYIDLLTYGLRDDYVKPMRTIQPAILAPQRLYTGKQVLTSLILNSLPVGAKLPNIVLVKDKKSKSKESSLWDNPPSSVDFDEFDLIMLDGYICTGMFDKNHLGPSKKGMLNHLREMYGDNRTSTILTAISRALNRYISYIGFSVSVKDGFLNETGDTVRKEMPKTIKTLGKAAAVIGFDLDPRIPMKTILCQQNTKKFEEKTKDVERKMKMFANEYVTKIVERCQKNMKETIPENNLLTMSLTGAKGSQANVMKIAILVGSIEIEGKRCPLTIAGGTLPSFKKFSTNPRARGFCYNRYSTGIDVQELFFESMAGRDGLVDTAVKTSNSGYLQRCLIKQLEDISVKPDGVVRDSSNAVIQEKYGSDGFDIVKSVNFQVSDHIDIFIRNLEHMKKKYRLDEEFPLNYQLPQSIKDRVKSAIEKYKQEHSIKLKKSQVKDLMEVVRRKVCGSFTENGSCVGIMAAQSIGEPSTQMTLNTFHNVGQSEMNVTLGIPRLKEIMQVGSSKIRTPNMECPILQNDSSISRAHQIKNKFNKFALKDAIEIPVPIYPLCRGRFAICFKAKATKEHDCQEILDYITNKFFAIFSKKLANNKNSRGIQIEETEEKDLLLNDEKPDRKRKADDDDKEDDDEEEEEVDKKAENDEDEEESDEDEDEEENDEEVKKLEDDEEVKKLEDEEVKKIEDDEEESEEEVLDIGYHSDNDLVKPESMEIEETEVVSLDRLNYMMEYRRNNAKNCVELIMDSDVERLDYTGILLSLIKTSLISSNKTIDKAFISAKNMFCTDGLNRQELLDYDNVFDIDRFYTNNFVEFSKMYGIEAGKAVFKKEVEEVFKPYKIQIDKHHLSLIADYVTRHGDFRVFNRHAMKSVSSQVQRATFETAIASFKAMLVTQSQDNVKSPSACLLLGKVPRMGTNSVDVILNKDEIIEEAEEEEMLI